MRRQVERRLCGGSLYGLSCGCKILSRSEASIHISVSSTLPVAVGGAEAAEACKWIS